MERLEGRHDVGAADRVGYVVKRYPRYSETFIVNEILAHEAAGLELEVFSLRPPVDTHFQDAIARVRAPVRYLSRAKLRARDLWEAIGAMRERRELLVAGLEAGWDVDVVDVSQAFELAAEVRARGIRHLHAHFGSSPATVARLAARLAGISYSFTAHAKDIFHEEVDFTALKEKLRDASSVVTVSDFNLRHLSDLEPAAASRLVRIYNGMHLDTFQLADPQGRSQRILAVGRLVEKKGFADLIDACALLNTAGRSVACRIVGAGPLEAELAQRIADKGLQDCVELTGPLPQEEVRREFRSAGVFAAPCVIGEDGNRDVLILKYERHRFKPGCAANTVMNLHALGADVTPFGFLGNDAAGIAVRDAFQEAGIPTQGIVTSGATTQKVRLVSGDVARPKQQILRLDLDNVCDDATASANLDEVVRRGGFDGIVVSDYLLGVATPARLATLREASPDALVSIDARAGLDRYPDVDLVTPNDGEAAVALARSVVTDDEATSGALELRERLRARAILLTRGNQGMLLADGETHRIAISGPSEIVDPSGAGDTVVAVAALARVAGANYLQAAHLANVAAGISVMKVGPASVTPAEILEAVHG